MAGAGYAGLNLPVSPIFCICRDQPEVLRLVCATSQESGGHVDAGGTGGIAVVGDLRGDRQRVAAGNRYSRLAVVIWLASLQ